MHVGLNLIFLVPGETGGMETYARELIPALLGEQSDLRITAFINREASMVRDGPWTEIESVLVPVRARRRAEWVRGEQQLLPRAAARAGIDVMHSLGGTGPAWGRFKRVVTIHDLIYKIYPEAHFRFRAAGMRILVPLAARQSHRIVVPSTSTRSDLVRLLHVSPEKIDVVPMGIGASRTEPTDESEVRARYDLGERRVVLCTSARRPHKNLGRLLEAWGLLPADRRPLLVLAGYRTPHEAELRAKAERLGLTADTRFPGWIPAGDLEALYDVSVCFVFPSLYEGFGLPVLEAMARGVPVACAGRASLTETAGSAARFFDPESPRAIADAVDAILTDPAAAQQLREAGLQQAARFTWGATARKTLDVYSRIGEE